MKHSALLRSLFPSDVAVVAAVPGEARGRLRPEEEACVVNAAPRRRLEFTAGRICARRALEQLGIADYALLPGPDRAPIWPAGVVGSISHTEGLCGAVTARRSAFHGVGLDIESAEPLAEQYWPLVLRATERRWLERFAAAQRGRPAKVMFSAKECAYKCQYPVHRQQLEFSDVEISLDLELGEFDAEFSRDRGARCPPGSRLGGRFVLSGAWVLTGAYMKTESAACGWD